MASALPVGSRVAERAAHDLVRAVVNGSAWVSVANRPGVLESVAASLMVEAQKLRDAA